MKGNRNIYEQPESNDPFQSDENKKKQSFHTLRRWTLLIDAALIVVMLLFPPKSYPTAKHYNMFVGYHFITWHGDYQKRFLQIEPVRLTFHVLGVLIISLLIIFAFKKDS